jgi:DNA-binding transcriptional LysR family regulator
LEAHFGVTLLDRAQRNQIIPTAEGLEVFQAAAPILQAFETLEDLTKKLSIGKPQTVRIGVYESIGINFLPLLLPRLRSKFPEVHFDIKSARSHILADWVTEGQLDCALISERPVSTTGNVTFAHDTLGLFVSSKHPLSRGGWDAVKRIGIGTLDSPPDGHPNYFKSFLKSVSAHNAIALTSDSCETLRSLASNGSVVATLPRRVATRHSDLIEIEPEVGELDEGAHELKLIYTKSRFETMAEFITQELLMLA